MRVERGTMGRLRSIVFVLIVIALVFLPTPVLATSVVGVEITSEAAIVIDFDTGLVLFEYNADEQRVPASMTKMIAVYVVFDAINEGLVSFDTLIDISEEVIRFSNVRAFTNVPLLPDTSYSVRELLDVVVVRSAGAATIALGEGIFGSEEALIEKMNEKMEQLGIEASFADSWGGSPDNMISARGMAEMTRAFIKEYPEVLGITEQSSVIFDEIEYNNTNWLIGERSDVDGFKTGFTNPAGWCFAGTALQDGHRIITVTMGSERGHRFPDTVVLLDYGFEIYNFVIADHFRNAIKPDGTTKTANTTLVPIKMYNIEISRHFDLRDLAILLNET